MKASTLFGLIFLLSVSQAASAFDYKMRANASNRPTNDIVDDGDAGNPVCQALGGCGATLSDGNGRDNLGGRFDFAGIFDSTFTGELCPDGGFELVGSPVFVTPEGFEFSGSSHVMYARGESIRYVMSELHGCLDLNTFTGQGTYTLTATGGTHQFEGVTGVLECSFTMVGVVGQFASPNQCSGELNVPHRW